MLPANVKWHIDESEYIELLTEYIYNDRTAEMVERGYPEGRAYAELSENDKTYFKVFARALMSAMG